jgi:hypothetical protein
MDEPSGVDRIRVRNAFLALVALCGLFVAAGVLVLGGDTLRPEPRLHLGDMRDAQVVEVRTLSGETVLSGEFRTITAAMGNIEKDAALMDRSGRQVVGEVEIDVSRPDAANPRQELEIDIISLTPNTEFAVYLDDRRAASFTTDDRGSIDIEIESAPPEETPQ